MGKRHIKGWAGWAALAALAAAPTLVMAAGLGRLVVQSGLGQPLKGEIEIMSPQRAELDTLSAKLAPPEAFRQANIDYGSALPYLRFSVDRRPGRPVIVVTSTQPIQEPFLDMLVELNWSGGRLVREYTVLLDPAEYKGPQAITAPPVVAAAPVETRPVESARPPAERAVTAQPGTRSVPPVAPLRGGAPEGGTYQVQRGDSLAKIAAARRPEGVTQQQMLVALYRANESAFINRNMNLLRSGSILSIPDRASAQSVAAPEASRVVVAQTQEFNARRSQTGAAVAAGPVRQAETQQRAAGRVTAKVEEAPLPPSAASKDQLRLSKPEDAGRAEKAARADDLVASDKALREVNGRVTDLEKTVRDLQKLLELKNQQLAQLEKQATKPSPGLKPAESPQPVAPPKPAEPPKVAVAPPAPAETVKPAEPARPAEPPKVAESPKPAEPAKPAESAKPGESPKPAEPSRPVESSGAAAPSAPSVVAPVPAPQAQAPKPVAAPPLVSEPSFVADLLDNPMALGVGGLALLALIGFAVYSRRRQRGSGLETSLAGATAADSSSVFGTTGGRNVDTGASSLQTDFSQSGLGAIDTDEVDPVAEADVYMAYGRDAQAEEILKEALLKDPNRQAVRVKLLEIYAARKDLNSFETTAGELYAATGGQGPDWERACALGVSIDPTNPMYGGKATDMLSTLPPGTVILPGVAATAAAPTPDIALEADDPMASSLDFDLGGTSGASAAPDFNLDTGTPSQAPEDLGFDLDLGEPSVKPHTPEESDFSPSGTFIMDAATKRPADASAQAQTAASDLNIDFELPEEPRAAPPAFDQTVRMQASGEHRVAPSAFDQTVKIRPGDHDLAHNLDFDLGSGAPTAESQPVDLSAISFDLGEPATDAAPPDARWQEVATKLDLAKAYEEMGDKDGARELLNEVMKEGDTAQQQQAKTLLEALR